MKCKECGDPIPDNEVVYAEFNGDKIEFPYCKKCAEMFRKRIDDYPNK